MEPNAEIVRTIDNHVALASLCPIEAAIEPADTDRTNGHELKIHRERAIKRALEIDRTVKRIPLILPKRKFFLIIQMGWKLLRSKNDFLNFSPDDLTT